MNYTDEQKENILRHYNSIEEYERITLEREARQYLKDTDYIVIKAYEYFLAGKELEKDYTEQMKKREEMRTIIRNLENNQ